MQQAKIRQDFFFFPDITEKPDQRYGAVGMQVWVYNTDSFCYQLFLVCLLCVTLSARGVWQQGRHNSIDTHKPGATKHRDAKSVSFHYFSHNNLYLSWSPHSHSSKNKASSSSVSPRGCLQLPGDLKSARKSGERTKVRNPVLAALSLLLDSSGKSPSLLCWPGPSSPFLEQDLSSPLSHSYCPFLTGASLLLHHFRHCLCLFLGTHQHLNSLPPFSTCFPFLDLRNLI